VATVVAKEPDSALLLDNGGTRFTLRRGLCAQLYVSAVA
jgi:hypothetical protein